MANVIRDAATTIYNLLDAEHESLFGYIPDAQDETKPNVIYYPSPPEGPVTKTSLTVGTEGYSVLPSAGGEAASSVTVKYRTDATEREWTDGGEEDMFDLSYKIIRLVNAAGRAFFEFEGADVVLYPPGNEATTQVGFDITFTCRVAAGIA
jgi:hypothetical protein